MTSSLLDFALREEYERVKRLGDKLSEEDFEKWDDYIEWKAYFEAYSYWKSIHEESSQVILT